MRGEAHGGSGFPVDGDAFRDRPQPPISRPKCGSFGQANGREQMSVDEADAIAGELFRLDEEPYFGVRRLNRRGTCATCGSVPPRRTNLRALSR